MTTPPTRPKTQAPLSESKRIKPSNKQGLKKEDEEALRDKLQKSGNGAVGWEIAYADIVCCDLLGTGTSGDVYSGTWNDKRCAIKVLKATNQAQEVEEFIKEFSVMINIKSDCIVQLYGACVNEELCMVMELCEKGSLYDVLQGPTKFDWPLGIRMFREITTGIKVLHDSTPSLFHRDLKSLNVLVTSDLHCRVADFGLSRFVVDENTITLGKCRGTAAYIAPEVFSKRGFIKESDIYSLSIILWEIVTRIILGEYERPYAEYPTWKADFTILANACKFNKRPTIKSGTPFIVEQLILDTWAVEPEQRGDCDALLKRIKGWEEEYESDKATWDPVVKNKL